MKRTLISIGFVSLALAGCGGGDVQNTANVPEPVIANANTVVAELPAAEPTPFTDANSALAEGNRLMDENQTESAIEVYKQAVALNPELAEAHFRLGVAYALLEMQMEQSGVVTEPASNVKVNPKAVPPKTKSEKAFEAAVKAYNKWIDKNPKDDIAFYYLGRTYAKLTKDEEAEKAFKEAVKLKPEDSEYQTELGSILIKLAQYREAISPLKKAIELDAANARAIDLLDDAEAGRKRVDYGVSNKNTNTAVVEKLPGPGSTSRSGTRTGSSSNVSTDTPSNSNSDSKQPPANSKPKKPEPEPKSKKGDPKEARPRMVGSKPIKP
jgi:tetratricopeptide (TPR) repeat protein